MNTPTTTIRTGTVLRVARGLLATVVLASFSPADTVRGDDEPITPETFARNLSPGAIGARGRLQPGPCPEGVLPDTVQPVEIRGPEGLMISIETAEGWSPLRPAPLRAGLVVGQPYRLRLAGFPAAPERELFPTVRILAKLASPPGQAWRFPVEVVIDEADLDDALSGALVRRVVYSACDPDTPDIVPAGWFDVRPGDDAFAVASTLGEPVAEFVVGNRVPAPGSVR